MRNFGESPKDVEESTLSQILEADAPPKYSLSATACRGILRRGVNRGKIEKLPMLLKIALCLQGELTGDEINDMGLLGEAEPIRDLNDKFSAGFLDRNSAKAHGIGYRDEQSPTLRAHMLPVVITACYDARGNGDGKIAPTVTGDHNSRVSDFSAIIITGVDTYNYCLCEGADPICYAIGNGQADQLWVHDKVGALNCMHDQQAIVYCLQGNCIDRADTAGCNGAGYKEDVSYTLNTIDRHAVCVLDGIGRSHCIKIIIRRLTPTECGRLQGMPDWWCSDIPHSDAAEYKMWGNGMALPNVLYIFEGLAQCNR